MRTIIYLALVATLGLFGQNVNAQEDEPSVSNYDYKQEITKLEEDKKYVMISEKQALKEAVLRIETQVLDDEITREEGEVLKMEAAQITAQNIENKLAIIDNKIALLERNKSYDAIAEDEEGSVIKFGNVFKIGGDNYKKRKIRYDRRTTSDFVFAFGLNNAIVEGQSLEDSSYKIGRSRFTELGIAWKTRVFENSGWLRFKYGVSFQFNGLAPTDNRTFVDQGETTTLEAFDEDLDKAKFRMDNLVVPVHFEFGPYKKIEGDGYIRYSTYRKFRLGIGGYAGVNLSTRQKLKFDRDGNDVKEKQKSDFNTNNFIYGLSSYVAWGGTALYIKYDLNTVFKNNPVEQRNISLGLRFDMD